MVSGAFIIERQHKGSSTGLFSDWPVNPVLAGSSVIFTPHRAIRDVETRELEEQISVIPDAYIQRMQQLFDEVKKLQDSLATQASELEIPEVFTLHPLSSHRVTVKVRKIEPARFYFVNEDIDLEDIED